jgi:hypothetical protein
MEVAESLSVEDRDRFDEPDCYLSPIQGRPASTQVREAELKAFVATLTYGSVCELSKDFELHCDFVEEFMDREVDAGRFVSERLESGEMVYRSTTRAIDSREVERVRKDIEFAVGMLQECFPGYVQSEPLDQQPDALAQAIRTRLSDAMHRLREHHYLPQHYQDVRFNHITIILILRDVMTDKSPRTIKSFILNRLDPALCAERQYYAEHREELVKENPGKFLLIREQKLIGAFDSYSEALREGARQFGTESFLIQRTMRHSASHDRTDSVLRGIPTRHADLHR